MYKTLNRYYYKNIEDGILDFEGKVTTKYWLLLQLTVTLSKKKVRCLCETRK